MSLLKFESMLKTNNVYFFDLVEFEEIIIHYIDQGKHSLAKKAVKLGLLQHPTSVDLKLLKIELYIFENELDKATKLLNKIAVLEPDNDEVYIQKASISSKKGQHKDAILHLEKALSLTDEKEDIWSFLGMEYLYVDDFKKARLNFENCIDADIENYAALYNIIYCFDMENNHEEAIDYLNTYIDRNPYCEIAWHQIGKQYFDLNRFDEALSSFNYAVLIDESFIGGYLEKAKTLEQLKEYEEAINNYLITIELDDPTAFVYLRIGQCYESLKDFPTAISYYKKAAHEDPLLDTTWVLLADVYYRESNYQKAAYYISKALNIDDNNPIYWRKYSEINIKLNFFEEAVIGFKNCLRLEDHAIDIYIAFVDVLTFLGEYTDALNILLQAQKIHKDHAEIEYRLSGLFFVLHKENYALSHLKNGLHLNYDYHFILKELFPTFLDNKKVQSLIQKYSVSNQ